MARVESSFRLCERDGIVGACLGPADTAVVTLHKDGVLQYQLQGDQALKQSWTLVGTPYKSFATKAVCVGGSHCAAVLKENARDVLVLWDLASPSLKDGRKAPLGSKAPVEIVAPKGDVKCAVALSRTGTASVIGPNVEVRELEVCNPGTARIAEVHACAGEASVQVCYLLKTKVGHEVRAYVISFTGGRRAIKCGVEECLAVPLGSTLGKVRLCGSSPGACYVCSESGRKVVRVESKAGQMEICELSAGWELDWRQGSARALTFPMRSPYVAIVGRVQQQHRQALCFSIFDEKRCYPTDVNLDALLEHEGSGALVEVAPGGDANSVIVVTAGCVHVVGLQTPEPTLRSAIGALGAGKRGVFVVAEPRPGLANMAHAPKQDPPSCSSDLPYQVFERLSFEDEGGDTVVSCGDGNWRAWVKQVDASSVDEEKLSALMHTFDIREMPSGLVCESWRKLVAAKCWRILTRLSKERVLYHSNMHAEVLSTLITQRQYPLVSSVLSGVVVLTAEDLSMLLRVVVEAAELRNGYARKCLLDILSKHPTPEAITWAVKGLGVEHAIKFLRCMAFVIKGGGQKARDEAGSAAGRATYRNAVLGASCLIDAHLSALMMTAESHKLIEELHKAAASELEQEKAISQTVHYLNDLDKIDVYDKPEEARTEFSVELLNIA